MSSPPSASGVDVELLLDRFLSASTATDCLDSLEQLQGQCRRRRPPPTSSGQRGGGGGDPKAKRPSQRADQLAEERMRAEEEEEERQTTAVDALLRNGSALRALCGLVSSSAMPPPRNGSKNAPSSYVGGMEVEGGDVAACELLSAVLPSPPGPAHAANVVGAAAAAAGGGTTTEELRRRQRQKRRAEHISKTLLHFHDAVDADGAVDAVVHALAPSLLDCLCASSSSSSADDRSPTAHAPTSVYARVLSLQILQSLLSASPGALREQLMMAPDGINRLVDLLGYGSSMGGGGGGAGGGGEDANSIPEEVRNESVLFLTSLASSSSMLARLITFSEGYDRSLKIALESSLASSSSSSSSSPSSGGSGLSSGSTVSMDCLELCLALAHGDEVARELFMGGVDGRGNLDRLARLVDLRGAERYRDKERNAWWEKELKDRRRKEKDRGTGKEDIVAAEGSEGAQSMDSIARRGGKRGKKSKDDDLDDILRGASSTTTAPDKSDAVQQSKKSQHQNMARTAEPESQPTPYLTPNEARIVDSVFNLILVLLRDGDENTPSTATNRSKRRGRAKSIMSHDLARYIVDCALYTLPPPGVDYVSGVPPPALQQKALLTMGVLGSLGDTVISVEEAAKADKNLHSDKDDAASANAIALRKKETEEEFKIQTKLLFETMPIYLHGWVTAIDRLMYLCCTGAYAPKFHADDDGDDFYDDERPEVTASLLSTYSISTFRSCLPSETASRMVLHALAPPPPDETDEMGAPLEPPVVTRLVTTLADNLRFLQTQQQRLEGSHLDMIDVYRATIGASGSAGALGVFLTRGEGDATREMLLRLSPPLPLDGPLQSEPSSANLIDFILHHIASYDPDATSNIRLHASSAYVTIVLLKLLSEWVIGMPRAVMEVLSSPSSVSVGVLVRSKKAGDSISEAVSALCGLLLGLCLEYMLDPDDGASGSLSVKEVPGMENIAWTKETIMNMVQSMGVGKYLNMIDEWKKRPLPLPYCKGEERSNMEQRAFASWYSHNVTLVRRRVVMALAGNRGDDSDESDAEGPNNDVCVNDRSSSSARSLRKMMSNQAQEIENLQIKLEDALLTIKSQSTQIKELKRMTELGTSAETIDMMTEYTEKMAELEKIKGDLKKEAENQTRLQEEAIAAKDREIVVVREELLESQTCVEEIRRDNETLREEMAGLSSAYNSLELQYHRTNSGNTSTVAPTEMTAGGEAAAEDGGARYHASGETAAELFGRNNNSEVQFLRDENARLREEGRAANEWMSMAVSKMEEMSGENESLARSLEEALTNLASTGSSDTDSLSIQHRMEVQSVLEESETKLKAKDDEIAKRQALVQQLEDRIEEFNVKDNDETPNPQLEELQQVIARQERELESLRQANSEAQDWMASAVTHVDKLTKEVQEKDEQLEEITNLRQASADGSNGLEIKITELENSLKDVTSELSESQKNQEKITFEMGALQKENADLLKRIGDNQAQVLSEKEALTVELDQVKLEKVTLETSLNHFQTWSETSQSHLAEVEAKLKEAISERDELVTRLESCAPGGNESSSQDNSQRLQSLQKELDEKTEQLERMQDQLIEDADENEAKIGKLLEDFEAEKQRAEGLCQEKSRLSSMIEKLSLEKEHLSSTLSEKEALQDSINAGKNDADIQVKEAQRRISDLEAGLCASEAKVHNLTALEEQVTTVTAERDEIQSQLNHITEKYENVCQSLESTGVESCNLSSKNQVLEQDNISLQNQLSELQRKLTEKDNDNSTLKNELDEIKTISEETVQLWQTRVQSLEADVSSLENQLEQQENEAAEAIAQWESRCSALEETISEETVQMWQKRTQSLEADVSSLENQLEQQENEAAEAIAQWESRCSALEESGGHVIRQWEERVQSLESDVTSLEHRLLQQEKEAAEAITHWEARCSALSEGEGVVIRQCEERVQSLESDVASLRIQLQQKEKEALESHAKFSEADKSLTATKDEFKTISQQTLALESTVTLMTSQIDILNKQIEEKSDAIECMQQQINDKDVSLANSDEELSVLAKELVETQQQSELVVKQWQERSEQLEASINELEHTIEETNKQSEEYVQMWQERAKNQEKEAAEAITQWEARCVTLNERIENLEGQLAASEIDSTIARLKSEMTNLTTELEVYKGNNEKMQTHLKESKELFDQRVNEWGEKEARFEQLERSCSDQQNKLDANKSALDGLKNMCSILQDENAKLLQESKEALKEKEESQVIVLELKEELRHTNEQLQSFATDQFTRKATEMATQALRHQMEEIRSHYSADQEALLSEIDARRSAEEEVERLKSDLALLAQATEYDDAVDVHVRKTAKKMSAENIKAERKEMEQLRSTLELLREELGSCRWNERQSEEKAANARLQMSILEQEITAVKNDLELMEQALEDIETSKINMGVSFEYRIEVLENELLWTERSHEEEMHGIKAELAESNEERDDLAHKLEQSEKANAALVYSTAHNGPCGEESESETIKLQLERAQLLAKISEMGANLERRVREAVAAHVSSSEAELIVEKQSRHSVQASLSEALAELEEVKTQMTDFASSTESGKLSDSDQRTQRLRESLDDMRKTNVKLLNKNKRLQVKLDTIDKENNSTISDLRDKLHKAEEDLRSNERESRFEAALAAEIDNLRASSHTASNGTHKHSQALVLIGMDQNMQSRTLFDEGKESIDRNSAYVVEMYDYVCELKSSIAEERQMYKDLLAEHEDLLALLGQAGLDGIQ